MTRSRNAGPRRHLPQVHAGTAPDRAVPTDGPRPPVSVVVCSRDRPDFLTRMLESLPPTLAAGDELIVVDSASRTAETREAASAAGATVVAVQRPGLSVARNAGVAAASHDIVVFSDDDCLVDPGWVDAIARPFSDERVAVVSGRLVDADVEGRPASGGNDALHFTRTAEGIDVGHGANMAFRRSSLTEIGGFDEQLGAGCAIAGADDLDAFCRLLRAGWAARYEPSAVILHRHTRVGSSYLDLMRGYGLGLGALAAKLVRLDGAVGWRVLLVVVVRTFRRAARRARRVPSARPAPSAAAEIMMLRGILRGFSAGMRMPLDGGRFAAPPARLRQRGEWT